MVTRKLKNVSVTAVPNLDTRVWLWQTSHLLSAKGKLALPPRFYTGLLSDRASLLVAFESLCRCKDWHRI